MKKSKDREHSFRVELEALLKAHGAELTVTDDGEPYGMQSPLCRIEMDAVYKTPNDLDTELLSEYCEFDL